MVNVLVVAWSEQGDWTISAVSIVDLNSQFSKKIWEQMSWSFAGNISTQRQNRVPPQIKIAIDFTLNTIINNLLFWCG